MSKQAEAELILKLYELRREATMRQARDWFAMEFHPDSPEDVKAAMFGPHSGHFRMVTSYWDMAAAMVHHEAISQDFFTDTNGEMFLVFAKMEPMLTELRAMLGPGFLGNVERLIDTLPNGRERSAMVRERMKGIRAQLMAAQKQQHQTASQN